MKQSIFQKLNLKNNSLTLFVIKLQVIVGLICFGIIFIGIKSHLEVNSKSKQEEIQSSIENVLLRILREKSSSGDLVYSLEQTRQIAQELGLQNIFLCKDHKEILQDPLQNN